jgi:hypothetical protein
MSRIMRRGVRHVRVSCDECFAERVVEPGMYGECEVCAEPGFSFVELDAALTVETVRIAEMIVGDERLLRAIRRASM